MRRSLHPRHHDRQRGVLATVGNAEFEGHDFAPVWFRLKLDGEHPTFEPAHARPACIQQVTHAFWSGRGEGLAVAGANTPEWYSGTLLPLPVTYPASPRRGPSWDGYKHRQAEGLPLSTELVR